MKRRIFRGGWIPVKVAAVVALMGVAAYGVQEPKESTAVKRPDVIVIDGLKAFGALERPAVLFFHDKHTEFVEKKNKDCTTCHPKEDKQRSFKFKRIKDTTRPAVMDIYHLGCIICHRENRASTEKTGPEACGQCHLEAPTVVSTRQPMGMDKWLHARHSKTLEKKCEACHHAYDAKAKKLYYAKGEEGTCRYCHKEVTEENRVSMRYASHDACIACHRERAAAALSAGPDRCAGCHDPAARQAFEKPETLPRIERKQPDVVFVRKGNMEAGGQGQDIRMNPVPFDHKAHEEYNATCRVCHHADLTSCSTCHTVAGKKEGKGIQLARAMHAMDQKASCLGCHETRQADASCAGCHAFIQKTREPEKGSCTLCHMTLPEPLPNPYTDAGAMETARRLLNTRLTMNDTFDMADIPEKVVIKAISEQYEPVELPHRKIVGTLVRNIQENPLARYFHREKGTVCQGCHHNSPAALKPPNCRSCHGEPFKENDLLKPGLMAAYHQQCMGCHREMGLEKPVATDCTACHIEKKRWLISGN